MKDSSENYSNNENNKRIDNILKRMNEKGYDGMLVTQFSNINYISNCNPSSFAVCLLKEDPILFTVAMDKQLADETSKIEVEVFKSITDLKKVFKKEKLEKIAIEGNFHINSYNRLKADETKGENWLMKVENFVEKERMIKSPQEIAKIKKATQIAHESFLELDIREKQANGLTDWEVAYELGYLIRSNGGSGESFETILASDQTSSYPHGIIENKKLGNLILMDWGAIYNNYSSDTSRTMIDENNEKQKEIFDIVLEAQKATIDGVKSGVKASKLDKIARSIIKEYGYEDKFTHATGHGVGLEVHESPSISKKDETILEENMVITIEPGIYLEGEFGIRIEDMLIVGKNKGEIIGNLPYNI